MGTRRTYTVYTCTGCGTDIHGSRLLPFRAEHAQCANCGATIALSEGAIIQSWQYFSMFCGMVLGLAIAWALSVAGVRQLSFESGFVGVWAGALVGYGAGWLLGAVAVVNMQR